MIECACCGNLTVEEEFDICPICGWEKDNVQENDPNFWGGANELSLNEAKEYFNKYGAPI